MLEFTAEQECYISSSIQQHVFLEACPGSGKTEVISAKVAKEVKSWKKHPGGMAVLSFSNSATDELKERVSRYLNTGITTYPHFLGTFDSFILKNIVNPLIFQILPHFHGVDGDYSIRVVEPSSPLNIKTRYQFGKKAKYTGKGRQISLKLAANQYSIDENNKVKFDTGERSIDSILSTIAFEHWEIEDLEQTKQKMWNAGYATYSDIEQMALHILKEVDFLEFQSLLAQRYPLLMVDECQDLSAEQLQILQYLADAGVKLHFVGDLHQSIYEFREVYPTKISDFVGKNKFKQLKLTQNFRSCQQIIDVCGNLTGRNGIMGQVSWLEPRCYLLQYDSCPTELIDSFDKLSKGFEDTVLISRGHSVLRKFQTSRSKLTGVYRLAIAIKTYNPSDMEALESSLQLLSEFFKEHIGQSVKPNSFNCPQDLNSSLSWRRFLNSCLNYFQSKKLHEMDEIWSKWTARTKAELRKLTQQSFCRDDLRLIMNCMDQVKIISPKGEAKNIVSDSIRDSNNDSFKHRRKTIHSSKGESHDVSILISSARASGVEGSHWKSWLGNKGEGARFAYVASSRPRHKLVWVTKKLSEPDVKQFEAIGFSVIPLGEQIL
ncbi:ATP-dependent helicase [Vibrio tubiashii]|uniref:DNA 3'-5' helicase II n=1 Tax=Vibrio tubiashii TaxID=29498 RepID=A0AAE5EWC3_9VIBR|nr:ATP-dependent helicase [Vibrio tubiashii]NOI82620.1 ATP-dependent helicase [Vibrio tubiashii]